MLALNLRLKGFGYTLAILLYKTDVLQLTILESATISNVWILCLTGEGSVHLFGKVSCGVGNLHDQDSVAAIHEFATQQ
jgi:hypothetical protein